MLIYESSAYDYSNSTDDGQGIVLDKAKEEALKKMVKSDNKTDRRLIDMVRVQQASRQGIKIGFKGMRLKEHEKFRLKGPNAKDSEFFEVVFEEEDDSYFYQKNDQNDKSKDENTVQKENSFQLGDALRRLSPTRQNININQSSFLLQNDVSTQPIVQQSAFLDKQIHSQEGTARDSKSPRKRSSSHSEDALSARDVEISPIESARSNRKRSKNIDADSRSSKLKSDSATVTRSQFDEVCQQARTQYHDFEEKIKAVELKLTGKVSSDYDLDQSTLYDNFINDETQGLDEIYEIIRKAHFRLIIKRKKYVAEKKEQLRGEERKDRRASKIGISKLQSNRTGSAGSEDDWLNYQTKQTLPEEEEKAMPDSKQQPAYIPRLVIDEGSDPDETFIGETQ